MTPYQYFAQPIVNITTKRVIVYELLLRQWTATTPHWRIPTDFDIDSQTTIHLLNTALKCLLPQSVSINLTNQQFADPKMLNALTAFTQTKMKPRQLTIELMQTPDFQTLKTIGAQYQQAGILIALDDVGSDNLYPAIKPMLPYVNTLKFAIQNLRRFGTPTTAAQREALHFWFEQAETHQLLFTFEGIEDQADSALATSLGITRGQGYFFARPQPITIKKDKS